MKHYKTADQTEKKLMILYIKQLEQEVPVIEHVLVAIGLIRLPSVRHAIA
jgi:hypothetical protein